ncbi:hypothetical protein [Variovorax sp.]|uniref:hypothetical protein n=1 Tax=Variovorax sp. TaxID=1871043 RepID=UPI002D5B0BA5|nr:hypothetical protein [Variovorax sp.]HYP84232.1 hypothetical protein [Variovorax sp.]
MSKRVADEREFVRGAAYMGELVYVITKVKSLREQDIAHTSLVGVYKGAWGDAFNTTWDSTALAFARRAPEKAVLIGEDGEVATYGKGQRTDESIRPAPVMIRNARTIEGDVYACGAKRQVYRRTGEHQWLDISAPRAAQTEALGFEAIDGYGHDDIYAAGWAGEIWHYDGQAWRSCDSPTNVILTAVCCAGDGVVYAAGQGGVMVRGRGDAWETIAWEDEVTIDMWDLCWFQDTLYVAGSTALFTLAQDRLVPVDMGGIGPVSCFSLSTAQGVLWSVGKANVVAFDGATWQRFD